MRREARDQIAFTLRGLGRQIAKGSGAGKAFLDKVKGLGFADAYLLSR